MFHYLKTPGSEDIDPDSHNFPQHFAINRATILWDGPKHAAYNSKATRLRSYIDWPHGMNPSPHSLRTAGFYFSGKKFFSNTLSLFCYRVAAKLFYPIVKDKQQPFFLSRQGKSVLFGRNK